ncbi:MAG: hypothetical protein L6R40_007685 [Gallowayella cf. fulva]|nr:MAG: hypothetical protein L6R40_007685 [Xanthomendoza cf. fulva]
MPSSALPTSLLWRILNDAIDPICQSWKRLVTGLLPEKHQLLWQEVMLWALQHQVDKAMQFLDATISNPTIIAPRYAAEDALKHIVSESLDGQVVDSETKNKLHNLICRFATASMLPQKVIYLATRHSDNDQVQALYEVLLNSRRTVHPHSLTHFMDRFTRMGRPDLAMDTLRRIATFGANVSYETVQFSCMKLLRTRFDDVGWYKIQSQLATEMLELGIRPGIPMLNAMICNAVEACDYQTAQAMFETARIHGIRRNAITYSILLKGALQCLDENLVERIMQMAEEDGTLPRNNELVFDLVVTMLQIARLNDTNLLTSARKYRAILRIYARYCNILPLQDLGIYIDVEEDHATASVVSEPSPKLLSVMLLSYIRLRGSPGDVEALYHRYQSLVDQNHHLIAATAKTEHLANGFLLFLGKNRTTFKTCPIILRNMLRPSASTTVTVAKPSVITWSILTNTYFLQGQRAAAEKVIQMMREHGVEMNQVTWNTVISRYASMQDAPAVVNAMKGMESAGFEADSYTLRALAKMTDRNQLLDALGRAAARADTAWANGQAERDSVYSTLETFPSKKDENVQYRSTRATPQAIDVSRQDIPDELVPPPQPRTFSQASLSTTNDSS